MGNRPINVSCRCLMKNITMAAIPTKDNPPISKMKSRFFGFTQVTSLALDTSPAAKSALALAENGKSDVCKSKNLSQLPSSTQYPSWQCSMFLKLWPVLKFQCVTMVGGISCWCPPIQKSYWVTLKRLVIDFLEFSLLGLRLDCHFGDSGTVMSNEWLHCHQKSFATHNWG